MKNLLLMIVLWFFSGLSQAETPVENPSHSVHHVVIVWLKQHGDEAIKQQYITASKPLVDIPGVLSYTIGIPAAIKRARPNPAVDESYDLAISSRFVSEQAYEEFLKNPEYLKLAQEVLRPLVEKYSIYDFVD